MRARVGERRSLSLAAAGCAGAAGMAPSWLGIRVGVRIGILGVCLEVVMVDGGRSDGVV